MDFAGHINLCQSLFKQMLLFFFFAALYEPIIQIVILCIAICTFISLDIVTHFIEWCRRQCSGSSSGCMSIGYQYYILFIMEMTSIASLKINNWLLIFSLAHSFITLHKIHLHFHLHICTYTHLYILLPIDSRPYFFDFIWPTYPYHPH